MPENLLPCHGSTRHRTITAVPKVLLVLPEYRGVFVYSARPNPPHRPFVSSVQKAGLYRQRGGWSAPYPTYPCSLTACLCACGVYTPPSPVRENRGCLHHADPCAASASLTYSPTSPPCAIPQLRKRSRSWQTSYRGSQPFPSPLPGQPPPPDQHSGERVMHCDVARRGWGPST